MCGSEAPGESTVADQREMRRLQAKWNQDTGWPKRLEWIEIDGIRGWDGQRFHFQFPIMAVVGENGVGKSTILQAAASIYRPDGPVTLKGRFASDFFPDTPWDHIRAAEIRGYVREGDSHVETSLRKPTDRWRGNPQRRQRHVEYIDLSRIQPVPARVGYAKLANPTFTEASSSEFEHSKLGRFCAILGRSYSGVKMALTNADANRQVPVISGTGGEFSGFHQGAGETALVELLTKDLPRYSLVLIDEVESSLHPRMQRRLIRDLAEICRVHELQIVLTTHSPYILEELPPEARAQILLTTDGHREIVHGVSPDFAMSLMDDVQHHECDVYVEDESAATLLIEILAGHSPGLVQRCQLIPYGAASVGQALGQMAAGNRFKRPSVVFLDGDRSEDRGCLLLPGEDAPERVVFERLRSAGWPKVSERVGRPYADVAGACENAMLLGDHHDWVRHAATQLVLSPANLWQAMCAEWATGCLAPADAEPIVRAVDDAINLGTGAAPSLPRSEPAAPVPEPEPVAATPAPAGSSEMPQLF